MQIEHGAAADKQQPTAEQGAEEQHTVAEEQHTATEDPVAEEQPTVAEEHTLSLSFSHTEGKFASLIAYNSILATPSMAVEQPVVVEGQSTETEGQGQGQRQEQPVVPVLTQEQTLPLNFAHTVEVTSFIVDRTAVSEEPTTTDASFEGSLFICAICSSGRHRWFRHSTATRREMQFSQAGGVSSVYQTGVGALVCTAGATVWASAPRVSPCT
ncbi:hypothetical protein B484DRAFT_422637 [Ochromonadaceae sp. CCMP2298]|nr:hypothetical protein B484DRAFT_422637 [Ochromonadaceae sp. CCMP2298]